MKSLGMWAMVCLAAFIIGKTAKTENKEVSDVVLENVEALANNEVGKELTCYNSITSQKGCQVRYCPICDYLEDSTDRWYSPSRTCTKM